MKFLAWAMVAAAGVALMLWTHRTRMHIDPSAPWARAVMAIGEADADTVPEGLSAVRTRARMLPLPGRARALVETMAAGNAEKATKIGSPIRPKLIAMPPEEFAGLAAWLRSGRLPGPGADEVLAGSDATESEQHAAGRTFKVVGVLKPDVALFSTSYLLPSPAEGGVFEGDAADTTAVSLIRLTEAGAADATIGERVAAAYPSDRFRLATPRLRPDVDSFRLYLAGQVLLLLGGTGVLTGLYRSLAARTATPNLRDPLRELAGRPRLLWGVHVAYFGLYVAGSLAAYSAPEINALLMSSVAQELGDEGKGPLAAAGKAYRTGSIPRAAAVTFMVNYPLGTLAMITGPSLVVPGSGSLLAAFRATSWGLLLGPTESIMAGRMIPHSGTLWLEGEGYILATFFALLVPIYLFGGGPVPVNLASVEANDEGEAPTVEADPPRPSIGRRFVRAVVMNLKGSIIVAVVLAVAAVYEAYEVIRMAGF